MTCPQCLECCLKKFIDVTFCVPANANNLSKTEIRKSEVQLVCVAWEKARYYCPNCGWHMKEDKEIKDFDYDYGKVK